MNEALDVPEVQQPRRSRSAMVALGVSMAALSALVTFPLVSSWVARAIPAATTAAEVAVGECFVLPSAGVGAIPAATDAVDCEEPHEGQSFAVGVWDEGSYPGDAEVLEAATEACTDPDLLATLAPAAWDMQIQLYLPSEASWSVGDRAWACAVTSSTSWTGSVLTD